MQGFDISRLGCPGGLDRPWTQKEKADVRAVMQKITQREEDMSQVDNKRKELAERINALDAEYTRGATPAHFFLLGLYFQEAWFTASELRRGESVNYYDGVIHQEIRFALQQLDWLDLLEA